MPHVIIYLPVGSLRVVAETELGNGREKGAASSVSRGIAANEKSCPGRPAPIREVFNGITEVQSGRRK